MLSSLKADAKRMAPVSHEAKLGMMVITVLFFAFCFLVYHKMDLHQRQLTQASIPLTADSPSPDQPLAAASQVASQSTKSAATDPLMNLADLRGEEAFGSALSSADVVTSSDSVRSAQSSPDLNATEESSQVREQTPAFGLESHAATEFPAANSPAEDSLPAFGFSDPATETSSSVEFPSADETGMTEPTELAELQSLSEAPALSEPDLEMMEPAEETSTDQTLSFSDDVSVPENAPPANNESLTAAAVADSSTPELAFGEPAEPEASAVLNSSDLQLGEAAPESQPEPVLLALAEPAAQDGFSNGFSGGFAADVVESSEPTMGRAPSEDSVESFSNSPPSPGYSAVTQPGRQSKGNSIRTAAGSGADGKFSLSAFNYQNTGTEPAPDDGSTFESTVVQDGDNYSRISKRVYGTTRYFSALAVFNQHRIREPKQMRPGMIVLTPAKEILEEKYPQLFVDSRPKVVQPAEFMILEDGSPAYRVGERETLSEISGRFLGRSSRWVEIYRLNQTVVKDPNKLKAGLILALPADAAEVIVAP